MAAFERPAPRIYPPDLAPDLALGPLDPPRAGDPAPGTQITPGNPHWNADGTLTRDITGADGTHSHEAWTLDGQHTRDTLDAHGNATHDVWTADGTHVHERSNADGLHVRDVWDPRGNHLRDAWDENGSHVRDVWGASGKHKRTAWQENPGAFPPAINGDGPPNTGPAGNGDDDGDDAGDNGDGNVGQTQAPTGGNLGGTPWAPLTGDNGGPPRWQPWSAPYSAPYCAPYPAPTGDGGFPTAVPVGGAGEPRMGPIAGTPGTTGFAPTGLDDHFQTPDNNIGRTDYDRELPGPARAPILIGFSPAQRTILSSAYQHTKRMVDAALAQLRSGQPDENFARWFGRPNAQNMQKVERVLTHIQHAMAHDQFTFVLDAPRDNWELAHVLFSSPHRIDLKPLFFNHAFGANTAEAVIAHELSHFPYIGNTKDHLYGPDAVANLAARNSLIATDNAENYGMFIRAQRTA
ncbi:M35 family metallopeptidase [Paraburkholderia sp. D15]|uniref:M35 family metallopeptidase n=1 Tax=Paraburkholderia sp. D15 TaxID=2880218 RepID=UPI002479F80B|nr:M35 family metallopeptidase [Paraburkholderia sp. D15]WGS48187.1 M35 family metallopeptidase [Paraburkholderia sp. D15]